MPSFAELHFRFFFLTRLSYKDSLLSFSFPVRPLLQGDLHVTPDFPKPSHASSLSLTVSMHVTVFPLYLI